MAFIHAGTHKTGTTSIQALLADNAALLAASGIYVPRTGRIVPGSAGYHNIAWELNNPYQFNPACGTLRELFEEIGQADLPTVCISSEEFEFLAGAPGRLAELAAGFRGIGYEPHAIVYLRPQADYLESLYAEIVKRWTVPFADFLGAIRSRGVYGESCFDYARLLQEFENAFGRECLHVRRYRNGARPDTLLREFLTIIGVGTRHALDVGAVRWPGRLNRKLNTGDLLETRAGVLAALNGEPVPELDAPPALLASDAPVAPLTLLDIFELLVAFGPSNEVVRRRYGVGLPTASWSLVWRELATLLLNDKPALQAKRQIRSLFGAANSVASG